MKHCELIHEFGRCPLKATWRMSLATSPSKRIYCCDDDRHKAATLLKDGNDNATIYINAIDAQGRLGPTFFV